MTPIATRIATPAYSNDVISLMKSPALASTITPVDVTGIKTYSLPWPA